MNEKETYIVCVTRIYSKEIKVFAENHEDAEAIAEELINSEQEVFYEEDAVGTLITAHTEKEYKELEKEF